MTTLCFADRTSLHALQNLAGGIPKNCVCSVEERKLFVWDDSKRYYGLFRYSGILEMGEQSTIEPYLWS